tara:strand:+ start:10471 stop:11538 length:1068 start_codon:yes stop_codon:yes gene_type:complete
MPDNERHNRPHFILQNNGESERFTSPPRVVPGASFPERDRSAHGNALLGKIQQLTPTLDQAVEQQHQAGLDEGLGLQIEFESFPNVELAFESLAREHWGIELRNVRVEGAQVFVTVFVPEGKLQFFEKLIADYLDESKDNKNGPRNQKLLNAISEIRAATISALWTDTPESFPSYDDELLWWEVWLPVKGDRKAVTEQFRETSTSLNFRIAPGELIFPERTVILMYGSVSQMKRSMMTLNSIAELRRAKETADFFDSLSAADQPQWVDELLSRTTLPEDSSDAPYVCILDTGVNNAHPLLRPALADSDKHCVEPGWGLDDIDGHGTGMAGVALLGNITDALIENQPISVGHRLNQ